MKESEFQARVIAMAERFGWSVWHVPAPMRWDPRTKRWVPARQGAGLPDLICLHDDPPRIVFIELKTKGGKLSERQLEFLKAAKEVAYDSREVRGIDDWTPNIGVFAAWPDDESLLEQMFRTKNVA